MDRHTLQIWAYYNAQSVVFMRIFAVCKPIVCEFATFFLTHINATFFFMIQHIRKKLQNSGIFSYFCIICIHVCLVFACIELLLATPDLK